MLQTLCPPSQPGAEKSVLASCLRGGSFVEVSAIVHPSDFYVFANRTIFEALAELHSKGKELSAKNAAEIVDLKGLTDDVRHEYFVDLWDYPQGNVSEEAEIVKVKSLLRDLQRACQQVLKEIDYPSMADAEILELAERLIFAVSQKRHTKLETLKVANVVNENTDIIAERHQLNKDGKRPTVGIGSGLIDLDAITGGFHPTELTIVAARPSVGKTALGVNFFYHAAMAAKIPCLFFSLEQGYLELGERLICLDSRVNSFRVRRGFLGPEERDCIAQSRERFEGVAGFICDKPGITMAQIFSECRRLKASDGIKMAIVDYLQLIAPENRRDQRHLQVGQISRDLKLMAKELRIPVIAMAQLNRTSEDREPRLSDLRESGSIEQDADNVILLHDPSRHEREKSPDLEILVAKQRNGPTGRLTAHFDRETMRFVNSAK